MSPTPLSAQAADILADRNLHFAAVVRYYRKFYQDLKRSGDEPYRMTQLGAWAASRAPHAYYFFRAGNLAAYDLFIDLGSGDGIVSCIAGLFTHSVGIEIDAYLCSIAREASGQLGLNARVNFICGDYLDHNIDRADCLYLYPDKPFDRLAKRLCKWQGTVFVYGPHLPPQSFEPVRALRCGKEQMVLYKNPSSGNDPMVITSDESSNTPCRHSGNR